MKLRIEFEEGSDRLDAVLPATGQPVARLADEAGARWVVVALDQPVEYQCKIGDPFQYQGIRANQLVIASRWQGQVIGDAEPTRVYILVPLTPAATQGERLDPTAFDFAGSGTCHAQAAA